MLIILFDECLEGVLYSNRKITKFAIGNKIKAYGVYYMNRFPRKTL